MRARDRVSDASSDFAPQNRTNATATVVSDSDGDDGHGALGDLSGASLKSEANCRSTNEARQQ